MKKLFTTALAFLLILTTVLCLGSCSCFHKTEKLPTQFEDQFIYSYIDTTIKSSVNGAQLNEKIDENNSKVLQGIFNKIIEIEMENPCEIKDEISVNIKISDTENYTYYLPTDGCNIVKYNGKYYQIAVSDRFIINDIFEKYGVVLQDYEEDTHEAHKVVLLKDKQTEAATEKSTSEKAE